MLVAGVLSSFDHIWAKETDTRLEISLRPRNGMWMTFRHDAAGDEHLAPALQQADGVI